MAENQLVSSYTNVHRSLSSDTFSSFNTIVSEEDDEKQKSSSTENQGQQHLVEMSIREYVINNWRWFHWLSPTKLRLRFSEPTPTTWEPDTSYQVVLTPPPRQQSPIFTSYENQNNQIHLKTTATVSLAPIKPIEKTTIPRFYPQVSSPPQPQAPTFWQSIGSLLSSFSLLGSCRSHQAVNQVSTVSQVSPHTFDPY